MQQTNFDVAVIVNIGPYSQVVEQTYGRFKIDACPKELPYTVLVIKPASEKYDIGDQRKATEWWEPRAIAEDIVKSNGLAKLGIFVAEGRRPTDREVQAAKTQLETWYHALVSEGDGFYAANRDVARNGITDNHRKAVVYFGLEREWSYVPSKMEPCPYCTNMIKPNVTVCPKCTAILNIPKAQAAGLITQQQAERLSHYRRKLKAEEDAEHAKTIQAPRASGSAVMGDGLDELEQQEPIDSRVATHEPTPIAAQAQERNRRARTHEAEPVVGSLTHTASLLSEEDEQVASERHTPKPEDKAWQTAEEEEGG